MNRIVENWNRSQEQLAKRQTGRRTIRIGGEVREILSKQSSKQESEKPSSDKDDS